MPRSAIIFKTLLSLLAIAFLVLAKLGSGEEPGQENNQPAWPGVFIQLGVMYQETYEKPVVGKGEKPETYRQKAIYMWTGGRFEILEITLARDPAFKERYAADVLKKEKNAPREREVNKKKAWLWEYPREEGKIDQLARRLVVLHDQDKAIILDQKGDGADLEVVAKKFDFVKVEKALANPPKR